MVDRQTFASREVEESVLAALTGPSAEIVLAGALAGFHFADFRRRSGGIAFTGCQKRKEKKEMPFNEKKKCRRQVNKSL